MKNTVRYHEHLMVGLRDPAEAAAYLNAVAEDGDIRFLLKAIRNVAEARGGIGGLARKTRMSRTTLYRTLSATGNQAIDTLDAILAAYGMRIGFFPLGRKTASAHA